MTFDQAYGIDKFNREFLRRGFKAKNRRKRGGGDKSILFNSSCDITFSALSKSSKIRQYFSD